MRNRFIGRKEELKLLRGLFDKNSSSLVAVYGRRRVGKSRLIEEFGKDSVLHTFTGLAPQSNTTAQSQLNEFSKQLSRIFGIENKTFTDWTDAFNELASHTNEGKVIILVDEITWIGNCDPDFLGKLKNVWDNEFKKNDRLVLILCGSVSSWINKNILNNTGFYGRISLKLHVREMPIIDSNEFWAHKNISIHEKLKILSVTGGIPKYLEEIKTNLSAEENIKQLCFIESGLLFNDFDYILSALVERKSTYYEKIITLLSDSSKEQNQIIDQLDIASGGFISAYLDELVIAGLLARDYSWHFKSEEISKLSKYRLSDNYLRFYIKYIKPNIPQIRNKKFNNIGLSSLPGYSSIMGLQIENLVLNNRNDIQEHIGLYNDEIVFDNPYFQRATARYKGCQIDYMIQTKFGNLYLCEIKFTRSIIKKNIIAEVEQKIKSLAVPRNFSVRPVLIHSSEVDDEVLDSNYFAKIIDLASLFDG